MNLFVCPCRCIHYGIHLSKSYITLNDPFECSENNWIIISISILVSGNKFLIERTKSKKNKNYFSRPRRHNDDLPNTTDGQINDPK